MYTFAVTKKNEPVENLTLEELKGDDISWYWVNFENPTREEEKLLDTYFKFHPLTIESCLNGIERPKMDFYEKYLFAILHRIHPDTQKVEEVDVFVGENFIVSFHQESWDGFLKIQELVKTSKCMDKLSSIDVFHMIIDELVDGYFPLMHNLEDEITDLEDNNDNLSTSELKKQVFAIRRRLTHMQKTIFPMRDLVYRIMNSTRIEKMEHHKIYFNDVYDHLIKLADLLLTNREITADIRDSYISSSADDMNRMMMKLTIITSIFMPLTLIAGIYGMNFVHMPELSGKYSYYIVLIGMGVLSVIMYTWFKKKGWFNN
jgi:magnesium transporter